MRHERLRSIRFAFPLDPRLRGDDEEWVSVSLKQNDKLDNEDIMRRG